MDQREAGSTQNYEIIEKETTDGTQKFVHKPKGSIAEMQSDDSIRRKKYKVELKKLQVELVKLQEWVRMKGLRVVVLFEGRDAAGKGGVLKRITAKLNPRICRVVALSKPTEREMGQWFFQRYVAHLPTKGEMVLFDRSWYNRAGVERVMGFCTDDEYEYFMNNVNTFEKMLIDDGIFLIKYWFSISDKEQEARFQLRINLPLKRWKLSPMDLESRARWEDYTRAKDVMVERTNTKEAPWYFVKADNKRKARLNCISHLLSKIPYEDPSHIPVELPKRKGSTGYQRKPIPLDNIVPEKY